MKHEDPRESMKKILRNIVVRILLFESKFLLLRYRPRVIAVTGSVGKTSTKDAIYEALNGSFRIRKSQKSYNSEIGVPLTILGLENAWGNALGWLVNIVFGFFRMIYSRQYPEVLVLEMGVGMPGDMERITRYVKPDIVVFTRLAEVPAHVEFFDSPEAVYREKAKLVQALKQDGIFVVCGDDTRSLAIRDTSDRKNITYGFERETSRLCGSKPEIIYEDRLGGLMVPSGVLFRVDEGGASLPVRIYGTLGRGHMYSALAALAVGVAMDQNIVLLTDRIKKYVVPPGRMRILEGIRNSTIIDDSYNSSPIAVMALFETMEAIETKGRKIALLGDMLELGKYSEQQHKMLGKHAVSTFDILATVGKRARGIAQGALHGGMSEKKILQFEDSREAGLFLRNFLREGDVICVKGSQGAGKDLVRTERAIVEMMAHPEKRQALLVRQDEEWERY